MTVIRSRPTAALKSSEQAYRSLFEANHLPMFVYDASTTEFLAVNVAAIELYGFSEDEFLTLRLADIGADAQLAEDRAAIVDGRLLGVVGPYVNWTKDGTRIQVIISSRQIEFSGRQARFVVAEDVTERQRVQTLLDRSERLASIGELAGGVAHDFNNILCLISPYAEMVAEAITPEAVTAHATDEDYWEAVRSDISQILIAVERGAELAFRLLAFAGREVFQPRALNVKSVVDEVAALLERSLGEHVELVISVAPETWSILFDPGLLEQVLLNLAVNARYALANGGTLTIAAENIPGHEPSSNHVRIRVTDNGVGMSADTLHRVFEPFFTTKPLGEGTGMGLASSYGLITRAGGTIDIESELGQGTQVTIVLPSGDEAIGDGHAATTYRADPSNRGETVLLVEDDDVLREAIRRMLAKSGFQVFPCADGAEALHLLGRTPTHFDVLLTDVVMPKMLGPELAQRARAEQAHIRVLFMSGYAAGAIGPTNGLDEGCDLLRKPFGHNQLLTKLHELLGLEPVQIRPGAMLGSGDAAHGVRDLLAELGDVSAN
jgi:PAS domain S-box-containing protein